jgi:aubergine-like protein
LIGQKIATNYNQGTTYTIEDIHWDKNPKITFPDPKNSNQEMSFAQYFKKKYGLEIKDMDQPMIVGVNECSNLPMLLVPELCFTTDVSNIWK